MKAILGQINLNEEEQIFVTCNICNKFSINCTEENQDIVISELTYHSKTCHPELWDEI